MGLEKSPDPKPKQGGYRLIEEADDSVVIGEDYDIDLDDVELWLE